MQRAAKVVFESHNQPSFNGAPEGESTERKRRCLREKKNERKGRRRRERKDGQPERIYFEGGTKTVREGGPSTVARMLSWLGHNLQSPPHAL